MVTGGESDPDSRRRLRWRGGRIRQFPGRPANDRAAPRARAQVERGVLSEDRRRAGAGDRGRLQAGHRARHPHQPAAEYQTRASARVHSLSARVARARPGASGAPVLRNPPRPDDDRPAVHPPADRRRARAAVDRGYIARGAGAGVPLARERGRSGPDQSRPRARVGISRPRGLARTGPDPDQLGPSPTMARPVPRLVGRGFSQLAGTGAGRHRPDVHHRTRPAQLVRDHRTRRGRDVRPVGGGAPAQAGGRTAVGPRGRRFARRLYRVRNRAELVTTGTDV